MVSTRFLTSSGDDKILLKGMPAKINTGGGNDTFIVENSMLRNFNIDGGAGIDNIKFNKSGIFTEFTFSNIERIDLADGVTITLTSEQLENVMESLTVSGINAGLHFYGVAGGKEETVRVFVEYEPYAFVPATTIKDAESTTYMRGVLEFDDAQTSDLFHNVINYNDFYKESLPEVDDDEEEGDDDDNPFTDDFKILEAYKNRNTVVDSDDDDDEHEEDDDDNHEEDDDDDSEEHDDDEHEVEFYARADGSNNADYGLGSNGVDYATLRLGDDTYFGHAGNDLLVGHQGADLLSGGEGNDIFLITSFGGALGAAGKADDGNPEWVDGDRIVGGVGIDTLRITGGASEETTVELNDDNFQSMEIVEIGATVSRLNVEDTALQLLHNHYYLNTSGKIEGKDLRAGQTADNVIVDASEVEANGLTFIGNANHNTFIGTQKDDTFIGNGGNDKLTGGKGADKFVFGAVVTQTVTGDATTVQSYEEVETDLTGVDTITDFQRGTDKIVLEAEMFDVFGEDEGVLAANLVIGTQAKDANDYLIFNPTTKTLSFDTDGNGKEESVEIVVLTGVTTLSASDFLID